MSLIGGSKSSKQETNKNASAGFSEIGGAANSQQLDVTGGAKFSTTNVSFNSTDQGAVNSAFDFANRQGAKAFEFAGVQSRSAFGTADKALNAVTGTARDALIQVGAANRDSLNFSETSLTKVLDFARTSTQKAQETVADSNRNFTNKFSEFANRTTADSDQKMSDLIKWGIGAAVAVVGFNAWNRGR